MSTQTKCETDILPLLRRHSVLCVDDEPYILAALRRTLRDEPYDLLTTESASNALKFIATRPISLVLADQRMPDMSGVEMLQVIQEHSPATAGVILTGYPETVSRQAGTAKGVRCVLVKPWNDRMLTRTLRQLLRELELIGMRASLEEERDRIDLGGEA